MSDYRAVAAFTATLQNLLQDAVSAVPGATVRAGRPDRDLGQGTPAGLINIFLYQAHSNPNFRNAELPVRRADGSLIRRPQLALDLHYLLSFYGDDTKQIPHLLLGLAASALHAHPYPDPAFMPKPELHPVDPSLDLGRSGLIDQAHLLRVIPLTMSHDELSKLWSIFFQVPYTLSIAYRCSVILIEPDLMPQQPALPVRGSRVGAVFPTLPPHLDEATPQVLPYRAGAVLTVRGSRLFGDMVALFGDLESPLDTVDARTARVRLPVGLVSGVNTVRVAHQGADRRPAMASNPVAFVLQPRLTAPPEVVAAPPAPGPHDSDERIPTLVLRLEPDVTPGQRLRVLLNGIAELTEEEEAAAEGAAAGGPLPSYVLTAAGLREPVSVVRQPISEVVAGTYLVRVEVDGVASPLEVETDAESPRFGRYNAPQVVIR